MADSDTLPENPTTPPAGLVPQLKHLWDGLSRGRRMALIAAGLGTLIGVGFLASGGSDERYDVLYSGLAADDAGQIVSELSARGTPYRLAGGGTVIEVPSGKVHEARLAMASSGLPRGGGGVGFEIFDEQSLSTTSFVEQVNYRRAMQGELSRTIGALAGVDSARVHIAMGRRSVFRDADEPPTASVTVRLRRGAELAPEQVGGIVHLVSSSVDGLDPKNVVVVDDRGRVLRDNEDSGGRDAQNKLERSLEERVRNMIARVVGPDNVEVVVTSEMDRRQVDQTEELYDKDSAALRSEARTVESTGAGEIGGIAGARGNLPGTAAPEAGAPNGTKRLSETRNYEVNKVVRRTAEAPARLKRLHVAVLVNYAAKPAEAAAKPAEGEAAEGEPAEAAAPQMVPRSAEELEHIAALAKSAAGINEDRGDVLEVRSVAFQPTPAEAAAGDAEAASALPFKLPLPLPILAAMAGGVLFLLATIISLLVWRRRRKRARAEAEAKAKALAEGEAEAPPSEVMSLPASIEALERALDANEAGADAEALPGAEPLQLPGDDLAGRIASAVREDPEHAADVLRAWLAEARAGALQ